MKNSADLGGCYPPRPSASVDNTLLYLQNSSYPTQPHSIIAKYLVEKQQYNFSDPCLNRTSNRHKTIFDVQWFPRASRLQLFRQRLSHKSVKAYATMPIGIMGRKSLALID